MSADLNGVVNAADFRRGMRHLAAAVSVITTEHEGRRAGMTATSVSSLTAEPPQIGVAINRTNASYAAVVGSRRFAVNVLSHEQAEVAASFRRDGGPGGRGALRRSTGVLGCAPHRGPDPRRCGGDFRLRAGSEGPAV